MASNKTRQQEIVDPRVAQLRERVVAWREKRTKHEGMPGALWKEAARVAAVYGVGRVARAVQIDHGKLRKLTTEGKRRPAKAECSNGQRNEANEFVECALPLWPAARSCELEVKAKAGVTVKLAISCLSREDLMAVVSTTLGAGQ